MFGFWITHEIITLWTNLTAAYTFIPTVATYGIFALTKITTAFNHINTANTFTTFRTFIFFPLITPIERSITYFTTTCIENGHDFLLPMTDNMYLSFYSPLSEYIFSLVVQQCYYREPYVQLINFRCLFPLPPSNGVRNPQMGGARRSWFDGNRLSTEPTPFGGANPAACPAKRSDAGSACTHCY